MWGKMILFLISSILSSGFLSGQSIEDYSDILEEGQKAVEEERFEQALQIWGSAADRTPASSTDPRIGVAYIELVTNRKMTSHYEDAVNMYFSGFSNAGHSEYEDYLEDELERLQPIVNHRKYRDWRRMLRKNRFGDVADEITRFWERMDPTINTQYNERLIEHWLRIDYSRSNFTRARSTIYETDDRALAYVKYGRPDIIRDGIFSYNSGLVRTWLEEALDMRGIDIPSPSGSDSVSRAAFQQQMRIAMARQITKLNDFERQVRFYHRYPSYEIWVYEDVETRSFHNLIYIFGNDGDTGEFGMRRSVEDMMPNGSFRSPPVGMRLSPSLFLQLLFYENLITVDNFFAESFNNMESKIFGLNQVGQWQSRQFWNQNKSRLTHARLSAPVQQSSLSENFPTVSVDTYQYRLLNEQNEPYLATFLMSNPYQAYLIDRLTEQEESLQSYRLYGAGIGLTGEDSLLFKQKSSPIGLRNIEGYYGRVDLIPPELLYMEVPHHEDMEEQVYSVELQSQKKDSTQIGERIFKQHIRAIGSSKVEDVEPPLTSRDGELQMGDLIIGTRERPFDEKLPFGFRVRPDATFEEGEDMYCPPGSVFIVKWRRRSTAISDRVCGNREGRLFQATFYKAGES
ncbi:MAG: GWxTD domain-containing protein [Balneolaceae bacterium]|nr:GWxTD domain-containing protein [Balneolaceae bacterium]